MEKIFITILNNSIVASWIILAVIILRFVFKKFIKKIPKWVNCLLWGLVAIRLVLNFSVESIFSLIPSANPVPANIEYAKVPQIDSGINVVNTAINPILENNFVAKEIASVNPIQIVIAVVSYLWLIGVIGLFIYAFVSFLMLKNRVKIVQLVDKGIFRCETIESPFILGILKPCVYVPDSLDEEAYQCVTEHEKAHIKRGDFIWKPLGFMILCVYWFNPLCWIAYICLCKDIEYACDEKVTRDKDKEWKAKYCQVLLDCSFERRLVSACPVAFGEVSVKERIKSVINYRKPSFWIICISIIACAIVGICFLTNPQNNTYSIKVSVPSGFDYNQSEEEFSPLKNKITITLEEGQEDATIYIIPIEVKTETAYDETITLSPGVPKTIEVEKGAWFEIGVTKNEEVQEDKEISFSIKGITVRIASHPVLATQTEEGPMSSILLESDDKQGALTQYSYYGLIHTIESAMYDPSLIEEHPSDYTDYDGNLICNSRFFSQLYDGNDNVAIKNFGYLICDIDGDGTDELLLGENKISGSRDSEYDGVIYDLYTQEGDTIKHIFSGGAGNRLYITNNNEFINEWKSETNEKDAIYYQYKNSKLSKIELLNQSSHPISPNFITIGPVWQEVADLNRDGLSDYIVYTGMDGSYSNMALYLTGEGKVFEHESQMAAENGNIVYSSDVDYDEENEIIIKIPFADIIAIKKTDDGWKKLERFSLYEDEDYSNWNSLGFDVLPLEGGMLCYEWTKDDPYWRFVAPKGTPVFAVKDGTVISGYNNNDGNYIILSIEGEDITFVKYSHLDTQYFDSPTYITAGTEIGTVGATGRATGPFLKIEISKESAN